VPDANAARYVQLLRELRADRQRNREPQPDRAASLPTGDAVPRQRAIYQCIGVQRFNQLDLGGTAARFGSSYADRQALVVRGTEHHLAGNAEHSASIGCGQPSDDVQLHERVSGYRHAVLSV
jgi:hypothetical protein